MRFPRVLPLLLGLAASVQAQSDAFPLRFAAGRVVSTDTLFDRPISAAIAPDGGLVVSDVGTRAIMKFSSDGTLQWRVGRQGRGPGEYLVPMRVVAMPDGTVLVYDAGRAQMARLNADGTYRDMIELDAAFSIIDSIVALPDGGIAICGIAQAGSRAEASAAIHIFNGAFKYVRSFGPVPPTKSPRTLSQWGAGGLTLGPHNELVFSRRHPYEIYRYQTDGRLLSLIRSPLPLVGTPDGAFGSNPGSMVAPLGVTLIRTAHVLADGRTLAGRSTGDVRTLDLFSASGAVLATRNGLLPNWSSIAAYDVRRRVMWVFGEVDDAPVLMQFSVR